MKKSLLKFTACVLALSSLFSSVTLGVSAQNVEQTSLQQEFSETQGLPVKTEVSVTQDFEPQADVNAGNPLDNWRSQKGTFALSDASVGMNHTENGVSSLNLIGIDSASQPGQFDVIYDVGEMQVGKKFSVWMYDDGNSYATNVIFLFGSSNDDSKANRMYFGMQSGQSTYRAYTATASNYTGFDNRTVAKSAGWHEFTIDMTVAGQVSFFVDGQPNGVAMIDEGEYAEFDQVSFINFWSSNAATPKNMYVDDITITETAPVPSNLSIDDNYDTLDWDYADKKTNPADYEYSVDGGATYNDVLTKPIYVGNIDVAQGDLMLRAKTDEGADYVFPSVSNESAFTYTQNVELFMERNVDLDYFATIGHTAPSKALSTVESRSGLTSMQVSSQGDGRFDIGKRYDEIVSGKVLTLWMYDDMADASYNNYISVQDLDEAGKWQSASLMGYQNGLSKTNYVIRPSWGSTEVTSVKRTEGWHSFQWDFTSGTTCKAYIDGVLVKEYDSNGFNSIELMDVWSQTQRTFYYDDLTVTDSLEEVPVVPAAPTNPVTNDNDNTFGWNYVEGKTSADLYEISIDNGETFTTCTANPQTVPAIMLDAGEVIVRLKETATEEAGSVLRNTERFTDPVDVVKDKLQEELDFIACANPADYTEESWAMLEEKITVAETAIESLEGLQDAFDALLAAQDTLVFDMAPDTRYDFDDQVLPVEPTLGTPEWDPSVNITYSMGMGLRLVPEQVGSLKVAQYTYTFPKAIEDKQITFRYFDNLNGGGNFEISVGNSETGQGHIIGSKNIDGSSNRTYQFIDIVDGEKTNQRDLNIRRREDMHTVEINMTNGNGTQIYMDDILVFSNPDLVAIDYLDFYLDNATSTATHMTIDEFSIYEKNPVTSISYPVDEVTLGYYDTYEMNLVNYEIEKPYDYETTDKFTYSTGDSDVAYISKGGSIQPMAMEGKTTATITSPHGVTKTIDVNVVDFKAESVNLSDNLVTQEPNFVTDITMEPGEIEILNAVITPEGVTNRDKIWTSSNSAVATINNGEIKALSVGTTVITVETVDGGHKDSVTVTVAEDSRVYGKEVFVATDGNDFTGDGTMENPFATAERARDELRGYSQLIEDGAVIYFREGNYAVTDTIAFEIQDSGNPDNPIKYSAYNEEDVTFVGGVRLAPADFELVSDEDTLNKLQDDAVGKVYQADISEYITGEYLKIPGVGYGMATDDPASVGGWLEDRGINVTTPYYSVSFDSSAMTLSRWPNVGDEVASSKFPGFTMINSFPDSGQFLRGWNPDQIGTSGYVPEDERDAFDSFTAKSTELAKRMATWEGIPIDGTDITELDIWYEGFTGVDYATQSSPIQYFNANGEVRSLIAGHYWTNPRDFTRLYVFNLIQELDIPGEWYLDKQTGMLYIMPPEGANMTSTEESISISMLSDTMFTFEDTNSISVEDLNLTDMLGSAFVMEGGSYNKFSNCNISNTSSRVGYIISSENGYPMYSGIEYSNIFDVNGGVSISTDSNGTSNVNDEEYHTLEPAYNFVHGNVFDNYQTMNKGFNSAVVVHGVGNSVSSNEIKNSPNNAIMWQGNDHVIEFNEIHHVDLETTDTSAIYSGRNTLHRGTVIKNNYFHHIGKTASNASANSAIYLDDLTSGIEIYDNLFEDVYWGVFANGGQDHTIIDNTFLECRYGVVANDWAYTGVGRWLQHGYGTIASPNNTTIAVEIDWNSEESVYNKYPYLSTIFEDNYLESKYNKVIGNTFIDTANIFHYMLREVQPATTAVAVIDDWYFDKDNIKQ